MGDAMDTKDTRCQHDEEETSHKVTDDNSSSFTEGKGSGQTGGARNSGLSAKSGAGSRAPKSAGKGGKGGKKNVVVVSMTPVKLEPEKKKLVKPKKARSAYNFFLEKRIAQLRDEGEIEKHRDRFSQAAGEWRGMTFGERVPFEDMARADKDRHQKDVDIATARNLSSSVEKHGQGMCSAIGFPGLKALDPNSPHDDVCIVCKEEGNLLCCDFCPVTHHLTCLEPPMTTLPSDDVQWACPACSAKVEVAEISAPQKSKRERKEGKKRQRASTSSGTGSPRDGGSGDVTKRGKESSGQFGSMEGSDGQILPREKGIEGDKRALDGTLSESIGGRGSSDSASMVKVAKQANIPQRVGLGLTDTPPELSPPLYSEEDGNYAQDKSASTSMMSLAAAAASVAASEAAAAAAASGLASAVAPPALLKNSIPPKMLGLKKMLNQRAQSDEASFNSSPPYSAKKLLKHRVLAAQSFQEPAVVAPLSPKMEGVEDPGNSHNSRGNIQNADWYPSDETRTDREAPDRGHFESLANRSTEETPGYGGSSSTTTQGVAQWDGGFNERQTFDAITETVEEKVDSNDREMAEEENLNRRWETDAMDGKEGRSLDNQRVEADAKSDGNLRDYQEHTSNINHRVESHGDGHSGDVDDVGTYNRDPTGVEGPAAKWPSGRRNLPRHDAFTSSGPSAYSPQQKLGQHPRQEQYPRGPEYYTDYRRGRNKFHYGVRGPEETDRPWMSSAYAQGPRPPYRQQFESSRGPAPTHQGSSASRGPPQAYSDTVLPKPFRREEHEWKSNRPGPINREEGFREAGRGAEDYDRHGRRGHAEFYGGGAATAIDAPSSRPDVPLRRETGRSGSGNGQWGPGNQNPVTDRGWNEQGLSRPIPPKNFGSKGRDVWTNEFQASERGPGGFVSDRRSHAARSGFDHDGSRLGLDGMRNSRFEYNPGRASSGDVVADEDCGYYGWGRHKRSMDAYNEDGSFSGPKKSTPWKGEASGSVGGRFQGGRLDSREFHREAASTTREGRSTDAQDQWSAVRACNDGRRSGLNFPNRRNDKGSWSGTLREPSDEGNPAKVRSPGRGPERSRTKDWGASRSPDNTARSDTGRDGFTRRGGPGAHRGRGGHKGVWRGRMGGRSGFYHNGEKPKAPFPDWRSAQPPMHAEKRQLSHQREEPPLGTGRTTAWSGKVADGDAASSDRGIGPPNVEDISEISSRRLGRRGRPDEPITNGCGGGSDSGEKGRRGMHGDQRREGSGSAHSARRDSDGRPTSGDARNSLDKSKKEPSFIIGQAAITGGRDGRAFPRTNRASGGEYSKFSVIKPGMTGYSASTSSSTTSGHTRVAPVTTAPLLRSDRARSHDREPKQQRRPSARSAAPNTTDWGWQGGGKRPRRSRSPPPERPVRRKTLPDSRRTDAGGDGHTNHRGESYDDFQRQGKPRGAWDAQRTQGAGVGRGNELGGPKPWRDKVESTVRNSDGRDGERFGGRTESHVKSSVGHRGNFPGRSQFGGRGRGAAPGRWHPGK